MGRRHPAHANLDERRRACDTEQALHVPAARNRRRSQQRRLGNDHVREDERAARRPRSALPTPASSRRHRWPVLRRQGSTDGRCRTAVQAKLTFNGSSAAFVTTLGPARGKIEVRLDGGSWTPIDVYAASSRPSGPCGRLQLRCRRSHARGEGHRNQERSVDCHASGHRRVPGAGREAPHRIPAAITARL